MGMQRRNWLIASGLSTLLLATTVGVIAQDQGSATTAPATDDVGMDFPAPKPVIGADEVSFETRLGSFKLLPYNEEAIPTGTLNMSFTGTILITGLEGDLQLGGNLRKEWEDKEAKKVAYFGTGTIRFNGKMKSLQWFGRNLKGTFKGNGFFRLYGEFDDKLETGFYTYKGETDRRPWGTQGMPMMVPQQIYNSGDNVKIKEE